MRDRCTNAAFVTAEMAGGEPVRLTGGRLRPGPTHEDFAELVDRDGRVEARLTSRSGELRQSIAVPTGPGTSTTSTSPA